MEQFPHSTYAVQSDTAIPGQKATIYATSPLLKVPGAPMAIKVKTNEVHDPSEIPAMRERAAALSHIVNQICGDAMQQMSERPTP